VGRRCRSVWFDDSWLQPTQSNRSFSSLGNLEKIDRAIGVPIPFTQQGLEADTAAVSLKINGESIAFDLLAMGITGGAAAVWSPCGIYAR
jgi:hypothetical protein